MIVDYYLAGGGRRGVHRAPAARSALREGPRWSRSASADDDAREATISAGADLFLDKPVVLRDLFQTLQVLSQRGSLA